MNFYKHHIGDYDADTAHLSWVEDAAYRRLISLYYRREAPVPADLAQACRLVRATSKPEREAVEAVLGEFFSLRDDGWHSKRCDEEIGHASKKAEVNRENGKGGGRPRKSKPNKEPIDNPSETQTVSAGKEVGNLSQTPDTRHQTPDSEHTHRGGPTEAGRVCGVLKRQGIPDPNPGHPKLLALIAAGATDAEFASAGASAVERGKGFAYAIGTLERQRVDAAQTAKTVHSGPIPIAPKRAFQTARERDTAAATARVREMTGGLLNGETDPTETIDMEATNVPRLESR